MGDGSERGAGDLADLQSSGSHLLIACIASASDLLLRSTYYMYMLVVHVSVRRSVRRRSSFREIPYSNKIAKTYLEFVGRVEVLFRARSAQRSAQPAQAGTLVLTRL